MIQALTGARTPFRILSTVAVAALLAGCQGGASGDATRTDASASAGQLLGSDVEAPEVFEMTDEALWDGRPSLGGVWIAAPDVRRPERVIIRNSDNGKYIVGALFKRERDNPGPTIQLSSDAAQGLGVLAGAPTRVQVVALRKQEEPDPIPTIVDPPEVAEDAETALTEETAVSAAADAAVDTATDAADPMARIAAAVDAAEAAAPETEAAPTSDAFPSATIFPDLEARVARAVAATEAAETPAAEAEANGAPAAAVTAQPIGAALPEAVPQAEAMQTAPKADITRQLAEPFIEIGKFRDENEARDAAERMAAAGVTARVSRERVRLRRVWRVVAGPAEDVEGHSAILRTAQEMGYSDAYPVGG